MARGARRPAQYRKLTDYEWRVFSRTGMLPSEARARGISLAAARGHAPRAIEPGGERIPEHRLRDIRRQLRGEPTEAERNFLRRQLARQSRGSHVTYEQLRDRFMSYSQQKRDLTRQRQAIAMRRFKSSRGRFKWTNDAPASWGSSPGGGGGGGGVGGGGGGGGGGPDFDEMTFDEFAGDWDDFPDYDSPDDILLFYH